MSKVKVQAMTLTFELATWFMFVTQGLLMMIAVVEWLEQLGYGAESRRIA